jgi:MYXO-CTERM domain-containing protein
MRRLLIVLAIVSPGWLLGSLVASAANSSAQIVNCAGTPPWCFSPKPIQVTVGSTVTWANTTAVAHTATSDSGAWSTGTIAPGATSSAIAFPTAGTFTYHCAIHPSMTGSVVVTAAAATSPPVRRLASGGGGPALPVGALLLLLGLGLLAARVRRDRTQRVSERVDKLRHQ